MVGRVGDDSFGQMQRRGMEALGVATGFVTVDPETPTGTALIIVDAQGQNSIVVVAGANGHLSPADVEAASSLIEGSDAVLLQLENPVPAVTRAAEMAWEKGVPVVLNPAPAPSAPLPAELLQRVSYLVPNEWEATALTGTRVTDRISAERAARRLGDQGVETVVVTLGDRGALAVSSEGTVYAPAFAVRAVDTTAAGDAFVAAFSVARCEGQPMAQALRFANAAGAMAVTRLGAQPSLPRREELESFLSESPR
jgi:ribokinase